MNPPDVQVLFFRHLKTVLPPHLSMVDEIADILGISIDSAYRRIRGDKPIDLAETHKLCSHFNISLDQLLNLRNDTFIFSGILKRPQQPNDFEAWLDDVQANLELITSNPHRQVYYLMKDIAPWVHFLIPELGAFRAFFYMKSILLDERLKGVRFSLNDQRYEVYRSQIKTISELNARISITEIWNIETLNSVLNQVQFYFDAGAFADKQDARVILEKVEELVNHTERQAELGQKFTIGTIPGATSASYRMFVNELILGNNTLLAEVGNTRITFINHSVLYFIATRDQRFNDSMYNDLENLMKKSTLISTVGEKDRAHFFNRLRDKIKDRRAGLL
jgi:hypothetical protein